MRISDFRFRILAFTDLWVFRHDANRKFAIRNTKFESAIGKLKLEMVKFALRG